MAKNAAGGYVRTTLSAIRRPRLSERRLHLSEPDPHRLPNRCSTPKFRRSAARTAASGTSGESPLLTGFKPFSGRPCHTAGGSLFAYRSNHSLHQLRLA